MDQKELKNSIFARMAGQKSNEGNTSSYNNINELKMDSKNILNKIITMLGMENKEVELGGCIVGNEKPTHKCFKCGHQW